MFHWLPNLNNPSCFVAQRPPTYCFWCTWLVGGALHSVASCLAQASKTDNLVSSHPDSCLWLCCGWKGNTSNRLHSSHHQISECSHWSCAWFAYWAVAVAMVLVLTYLSSLESLGRGKSRLTERNILKAATRFELPITPSNTCRSRGIQRLEIRKRLLRKGQWREQWALLHEAT